MFEATKFSIETAKNSEFKKQDFFEIDSCELGKRFYLILLIYRPIFLLLIYKKNTLKSLMIKSLLIISMIFFHISLING